MMMVMMVMMVILMILMSMISDDDYDDDYEGCIYDVVLMEHICLKRYSITKKSCLKMFEGVLKRNNGNVMHSKHYNTVCYQAV